MARVSCACTGIRCCRVCQPAAAGAGKNWPRALTDWPHGSTPPGVRVVSDFLSPAEETWLIRAIDGDGTDWVPSVSGRRKQDYGPTANFKKQKLKWNTFYGLPHWLISKFGEAAPTRPLLARVQDHSPEFECIECLCLEYTQEMGSHIDPHKDDSWLWGERLISLSLAGECTMSFIADVDITASQPANVKHAADGTAAGTSTSVSPSAPPPPTTAGEETSTPPAQFRCRVAVPRRSLLIVEGEARHRWRRH
jgi:alkylated DNA repair protein alkB family protein 4